MNMRVLDLEKFVAILSSTIAPIDGRYDIRTLTRADIQKINMSGIVHYIGHPSTKKIIEELGAIPATTKLFTGLAVGEQALIVSLALSNRTEKGYTVDQEVRLDQLNFRIMRKLL